MAESPPAVVQRDAKNPPRGAAAPRPVMTRYKENDWVRSERSSQAVAAIAAALAVLGRRARIGARAVVYSLAGCLETTSNRR